MMSSGMRIFLFQLCEVEKVTITDVKKTLNLVETTLKNQNLQDVQIKLLWQCKILQNKEMLIGNPVKDFKKPYNYVHVPWLGQINLIQITNKNQTIGHDL